MANYTKWTKEDLIQRVKQLENELKTRDGGRQPLAVDGPTPKDDGSEAGSLLAGEPAKKKQKKKNNSFDPSKYSTRFIALKIAYLGKNYNGFEYQPTGVQATVEEELWKALVKACLISPDPERPHEVDWNVCGYSKCGRTDRGVSAFGQVVGLRVRSNKPARRTAAARPAVEGEGGEAAEGGQGDEVMAEGDEDTPLPVSEEIQYCRMLNRILPPDIKVYAWCPSPPPDFSARFSCRERQYRYFFTQPAFAPLPNFLENKPNHAQTSTRPRPKDGWLDIDAMRQAARLFEGLQDFRNFCKVDPSKQITNFERRIFESDIVEVDGVDSCIPYLTSPHFRDPNRVAALDGQSDGSGSDVRYPKVYYFHVRGSAFLYHQIRCMVSILFLVGQGLESPSVVTELLDPEKQPRRPNYVLAEDTPLVLWDCIFGRDNPEGTPDELNWVYAGDDSPLNLHGSWGVANDLWEYWHEKKMDEILANRLLDWVTTKTGVDRTADAFDSKAKTWKSIKVYEGGNGPRYVGNYVPVLKKDVLQSPEELNDKYAQRKGFKNAEEMRAKGNWREAIRAARDGT